MILFLQIIAGLFLFILVLVGAAFLYGYWIFGIEAKEDEKRDPNFGDDWWL